MTITERLSLYRKAKIHYLVSSFLPKRWFNTHNGLCFYFSYNHRVYFINKNLPEIQEAKQMLKSKETNTDYWFDQGKIGPRLNILNAAIKITKGKIIHDRNNN